jgi:pyruvate dehydrogenase E2 component (dihydrolipoamide acetyltransferase)
MIDFRMPALGADMEAGTLVQWMKHPGDVLARGDIIAVVDTEKGAIEIEVYDAGVLADTLVQPGEKVPVGTVLAHIRSSAEPAGAAAPSPPAALAPDSPRPLPIPAAGAMPGSAQAAQASRATPGARKTAEERHVDLARVPGTGPGGTITRQDVERAASSPSRAGGMRAAIAAAMARSKREIPHLYLGTVIDMSRANAWLTSANEARPVTARLLPLVLLLKAVARAMVEVPQVNGFYTNGAFQPGPGVHIGCAIALRDGGLVAPALHDVDRKDLDALMRDLRDLITRTRAGSLRSSELADSTITVTSLGDLGVESVFGVIYPPQVAIVGFGRVTDRPWVVDGRVEPRPVVEATISADHRAVDGRQAGLFLSALAQRLQAPEAL